MKKIFKDNGKKSWDTAKNFLKMVSGNKKKYIPLIAVLLLFVPYGITAGAVLIRDYRKQEREREESEEEPILIGASFFIFQNPC